MFQSLTGTIHTRSRVLGIILSDGVSIPHRYDSHRIFR